MTLAAVAIVLVAVPFATLLFEVLAKGPLTRLDTRIANRLNDVVYRSPAAVRILEIISWMGKPVSLWIVGAIAAGYVWWRGRHRLAAFLVVTPVVGGLIDTAVKILVNRPRPHVDHPIATAAGKSFPSGHSMSSTITYGALLLVFLPAFRRRWRPYVVAATVVLVLAIGCSRLLLGVHFLSDVIGGFVLGLAWLAAAVAAFETWREEEGRRRTDPLSEGVEPEAGPALRDDAPVS
ncbi:MAG TPA: phosphatase PAP2 family protein [Acidimicrobiales bacterium]|nr:phosphatase PAP2 family protein [Acidimicrobiales bacterium]